MYVLVPKFYFIYFHIFHFIYFWLIDLYLFKFFVLFLSLVFRFSLCFATSFGEFLEYILYLLIYRNIYESVVLLMTTERPVSL